MAHSLPLAEKTKLMQTSDKHQLLSEAPGSGAGPPRGCEDLTGRSLGRGLRGPGRGPFVTGPWGGRILKFPERSSPPGPGWASKASHPPVANAPRLRAPAHWGLCGDSPGRPSTGGRKSEAVLTARRCPEPRRAPVGGPEVKARLGRSAASLSDPGAHLGSGTFAWPPGLAAACVRSPRPHGGPASGATGPAV